MTRNQLIFVSICMLTIMTTYVAGIWASRELPMDCTGQSAEMAVWVTECAKGSWANGPNCTKSAREIFCKPVCPNE